MKFNENFAIIRQSPEDRSTVIVKCLHKNFEKTFPSNNDSYRILLASCLLTYLPRFSLAPMKFRYRRLMLPKNVLLSFVTDAGQ